jgi:YidC/Oxa1 family membrane protein insertase
MANLPAVRTTSLPLKLSTLTHLFRQGVVVYLITNVIAMTAQSLILRVPSIRKALNIPRIPNHLRVKPPTFLETVRFGVDWFKSKSAEAQAQARAQQRKKF